MRRGGRGVGRWIGFIPTALLIGCAHGSSPVGNARATASAAPGVCRPEPRYQRFDVVDAGVSIYADPARVPDATVKAVGEYARVAKRDLQSFFHIAGPASYRIFIAGSTDEFDALAGSKTDWGAYDWIVGVRLVDGTHVLRAPATWSAKSRSFVKVDELIKHEMAHSFTFMLNGKGRMPGCSADEATSGLGNWLWFEEGLASFAAGQHLTWRGRAKFNFEEYPHLAQIATYGNYTTAASAVEYLIDRFSKERVFDVLRRLPANYSSTLSPEDVSREIAAEFAPVPLVDLERGWRKFALRTYRSIE